MNKKGICVVVITSALLFISSCQTPELKPALEPEPSIPTHFTTYTCEGLFSVSYPSDWSPATSIMDEIWEETVEEMKSEFGEESLDLDDTQLLFFCGFPTDEGWYPTVSITVAPRSVGFWTLDEVVESETLWSRENTQEYHINSQLTTTVDGLSSIILDDQDYEPEYGTWRYLSLYTVKDEFVWIIVCSCENIDFQDCKDDFNSVVRSLRILN